MKMKVNISALVALFFVGFSQTAFAKDSVLPSACTILEKINFAAKVDFEPVYKGQTEPEIKILKSGGKRYLSSCEIYAPGAKASQIEISVKQEIGTTLRRGKNFMKNYQKTAIPQNVESEFIDIASGAVYQNYSQDYKMLWLIYGKGNTDISMNTNKSKYGKELLIEIAEEIDKIYY